MIHSLPFLLNSLFLLSVMILDGEIIFHGYCCLSLYILYIKSEIYGWPYNYCNMISLLGLVADMEKGWFLIGYHFIRRC